MFLHLYRFEQTHTWHDICVAQWDPEAETSGVDHIVGYTWAISPEVIRRHDGGWHSRKDSSYTETTLVERVGAVPLGEKPDNQPSFREWKRQLRDITPEWLDPFLFPVSFWRYRAGWLLKSKLQDIRRWWAQR